MLNFLKWGPLYGNTKDAQTFNTKNFCDIYGRSAIVVEKKFQWLFHFYGNKINNFYKRKKSKYYVQFFVPIIMGTKQ